MTLFIYCFFCILTFILSFIQNKHFSSYVFVFLCLILWSIVARVYSVQQDFLVYADAMTYEWGFYGSFYVLREPVYWVASKILYDFLNNSSLVFFAMDLIIFVLLTYVAYLKNIKPYFLLLLLLFFPNVMGFLNIYRQFLATILLFVSFLIVHEKYYNSKVLYFISILTHNVCFIFLPLIFVNKKLFQLKFILASFLSVIAMILMSGTKSEMDTGETSPVLFFFVLCFGTFIFLLLNKFVLNKVNADFYYVSFYGTVISFFSVMFLADAPAKRISMIALVFLLYAIYWFIEKNKKNILIFRFGLILFSLLPTFLFSSVFNMLVFSGS